MNDEQFIDEQVSLLRQGLQPDELKKKIGIYVFSELNLDFRKSVYRCMDLFYIIANQR